MVRSSRDPVDRADKLLRLKAFGLWIKGDVTLFKIATALDIVAQNPSTAVGRARTKIDQGWRIIMEAKVPRWDAYWSEQFPWAQWQYLSGARLATHPRKKPEPVLPEPTALEILLLRVEEVEHDAIQEGYHALANGLRNLRAAVAYNERTKFTERKKTVAGV